MQSSSVMSEAVVFFGSKGVTKSMMYTDFEAILDGMVGIPEFAGREMKTAYCLVNGALKIQALVLFLIEFDDDGMADTSWNIPLRHLAEHGGPGPDMGAGPIRLACRSQCPVAWHQEHLWDPSMKKGANDFVFIRDAVRDRGAKMGLYVDDAMLDQDKATAPKDSPFAGPLETQTGIPVLKDDEPVDEEVPVLDAEPPELTERDEEERARLGQAIKELRLQITTLENSHDEELGQLRYAHEQKEEILSNQLEKVLMQLKNLKSQSIALKEQNASLKSQVESLQNSLEEQATRTAEKGSEVEILTEQYKEALEQRIEEEQARLAEQLHAVEMEVFDRDEKIDILREELQDTKRDQVKVANSGAEKILEKLQQLGLNFIAFHPGAGHIQVSANEISQYMQNPIAFAARKCLVTEEHYRAWLEHYENPVCQVDTGGGKVCAKRVVRVDAPNKFKQGVSDRNFNRCQHCQSGSALETLLSSRHNS